MGLTFAAVGEYFAGTAAVVGGADAAVASAGALAAAGGGDIAAGAAAAAAGSGGAAAGGALAGAAGGAAAGGGSSIGSLGTAVATAAAGQLTGSLLAPKGQRAPGVPAPITMPDPQAQEAATRKSLVEQLARRGRASTILTDPASGKLGG